MDYSSFLSDVGIKRGDSRDFDMMVLSESLNTEMGLANPSASAEQPTHYDSAARIDEFTTCLVPDCVEKLSTNYMRVSWFAVVGRVPPNRWHWLATHDPSYILFVCASLTWKIHSDPYAAISHVHRPHEGFGICAGRHPVSLLPKVW